MVKEVLYFSWWIFFCNKSCGDVLRQVHIFTFYIPVWFMLLLFLMRDFSFYVLFMYLTVIYICCFDVRYKVFLGKISVVFISPQVFFFFFFHPFPSLFTRSFALLIFLVIRFPVVEGRFTVLWSCPNFPFVLRHHRLFYHHHHHPPTSPTNTNITTYQHHAPTPPTPPTPSSLTNTIIIHQHRLSCPSTPHRHYRHFHHHYHHHQSHFPLSFRYSYLPFLTSVYCFFPIRQRGRRTSSGMWNEVLYVLE